MTTIDSSKGLRIALWTLRVLLAGIFLPAAVMKLMGQPSMVHEFDVVGLGQGLRYLAGVMELAGGIAVLVPAVSALGAIVLLAVDVGAFAAQIESLHGDLIHIFVFAAMIVAVIFLQRDRLLPLGIGGSQRVRVAE